MSCKLEHFKINTITKIKYVKKSIKYITKILVAKVNKSFVLNF